MCGFSTFFHDESGAVTIDWVVLAAACVSLGLGVTNVVATEMTSLTQEIRAELQRDMMNNPFDLENLSASDCAYLYLDPNADPAAAQSPDNGNGCAVGGNSSSQNNAEATTSYAVEITG